MTDRTVAKRMRRYRAKRALIRAIERAENLGVDIEAVFDAYPSGCVTAIAVTADSTIDMFASDRSGDRHYGDGE